MFLKFILIISLGYSSSARSDMGGGYKVTPEMKQAFVLAANERTQSIMKINLNQIQLIKNCLATAEQSAYCQTEIDAILNTIDTSFSKARAHLFLYNFYSLISIQALIQHFKSTMLSQPYQKLFLPVKRISLNNPLTPTVLFTHPDYNLKQTEISQSEMQKILQGDTSSGQAGLFEEFTAACALIKQSNLCQHMKLNYDSTQHAFYFEKPNLTRNDLMKLLNSLEFMSPEGNYNHFMALSDLHKRAYLSLIVTAPYLALISPPQNSINHEAELLLELKVATEQMEKIAQKALDRQKYTYDLVRYNMTNLEAENKKSTGKTYWAQFLGLTDKLFAIRDDALGVRRDLEVLRYGNVVDSLIDFPNASMRKLARTESIDWKAVRTDLESDLNINDLKGLGADIGTAITGSLMCLILPSKKWLAAKEVMSPLMALRMQPGFWAKLVSLCAPIAGHSLDFIFVLRRVNDYTKIYNEVFLAIHQQACVMNPALSNGEFVIDDRKIEGNSKTCKFVASTYLHDLEALTEADQQILIEAAMVPIGNHGIPLVLKSLAKLSRFSAKILLKQINAIRSKTGLTPIVISLLPLQDNNSQKQ